MFEWRMKYVPVEGETIPKHLKYGPRRSEGLVLSTHEWWKITDHLVKDQREREMLAVLKAKEEAKKEISFKMTSNWTNTLTSFKAQGCQKRIAKKEKENQEKIDQYNEILLKRKKEKNEILAEMKKSLNENKNFVKDLKSAILFSTVLQERQKQIELKNDIKKEEKKKEIELFIKYKKDAEDFEKQKLEEKLKEKTKRKNQKEDLDNQVISKKLRRQKEADELVQEQQDLNNMRIEDEEIRKCEAIQKRRKKELLARYCKKTEAEPDYEKTIQLEEEEEENKINDLYKIYEKKFEKEKKEKEKKMREDEIIKRNKITEKLVEKLEETLAKEDEIREAAFEEKERTAAREEKEKEKLKKQMLDDILELKRKEEEKITREKYDTKEKKKWEIMQAYRRGEMHEEWKNCQRKKQKESEEATRAVYEAQARELQERRKKELEELLSPAQDDFLDKEEFLKYRKDVLDFVQEQKMPEYPVLKAVTRAEKEFGMRRNEEKEKTQYVSKEDCRQPQIPKGFLPSGCHCFKH